MSKSNENETDKSFGLRPSKEERRKLKKRRKQRQVARGRGYVSRD